MAAARKRRHTEDQQQHSSITAFGTIGKPHETAVGSKKRKTAHAQPVQVSSPTAVANHVSLRGSKRKRNPAEDDDAKDTTLSVGSTQPLAQATTQAAAPSTPRSKRGKTVHLPSPSGTPSKGAAALLGILNLDAARTVSEIQPYDTPPYSPEGKLSQRHSETDLPDELQDFLRLYSAFLAALSLYYAHNGASSPVEIKALLPMVTMHWKKRAVTIVDLQRLMAVANGRSDFELRDGGRAGLRLVQVRPRGRQEMRNANYVEETEMSMVFESALRKRWVNWKVSAQENDCSATTFLAALPLCEIEIDESARHDLSRGQQRLLDMKSSQAASSPQTAQRPVVSPESATSRAVHSRGANLLDRILAKQAHTASLPAGPTKTQLERKAALYRIEDIARILELLAAGRPRCSFSMHAISQQLQQSLRNPISKEEVERCLDLMATEITPGFVSLLRSGTVQGVVVTKGGKVDLELLRARIERATSAL